jgi:hypothetical protein
LPIGKSLLPLIGADERLKIFSRECTRMTGIEYSNLRQQLGPMFMNRNPQCVRTFNVLTISTQFSRRKFFSSQFFQLTNSVTPAF